MPVTRIPIFSLTTTSGSRDLSSFPTRRSSDLSNLLSTGRTRLTLKVIAPLAPRITKRGGPGHDFWGHPNKDRKSTRLNSSHTVISYAVFCLKKKKYGCVRLVLLVIGLLVVCAS